MVITHAFDHNYFLNPNFEHLDIPGDSRDAVDWRLKTKPDDIDLLHYKKNPIVYSTNNYKFRTPVDFEQGMDGNIFLGCSHTFGIGHYLENTWSYIVNEKVGGNFLNLSVAGTGIGTASRLLHAFKDILKPNNVFLFFPHPYRFEFYDPVCEKWMTHAPYYDYTVPFKRIQPTFHSRVAFSQKNNMEMYWKLHFNHIESICKELNAPLYVIPQYKEKRFYHKESKFYKYDKVPYKARDVMHKSVPEQIHIAEMYYSAYINKQEPFKKPWKKNDIKLSML